MTAIEIKTGVTGRKREFVASPRIRATTMIVPIAIATPMQSAATTTFASVSLPSWNV